ncbi:MAG TPA: glycosyltransferase family 39 protein [Polyangiaceae bacterium]|nr:glycosyltransferase family 39 protein [Polyangiaceae bacterium]
MTGQKPLERLDARIAVGLGGGYLALLLSGVHSLGYTRDEGFYAYAARVLELWFELVREQGFAAFSRVNVDHFFGVNHEHPVLMKFLFALSHRSFHERWPIFESGTALRLPGMLMAALAVGVIYCWGRETAGRAAGVVSALLFAFMPRVFFHAHLACFDVAVTSMWLVTSYAYVHAFLRPRVASVLGAGVLYGLFLDTKHNAWIFPFALLAHLACVRIFERWRRLPRSGTRVPWALLGVVGIGPCVLFLCWPWLWFDTGARLLEWFHFHLAHDYYNMEFLGRTYWKPPMPRLYAPVMTLATVPLVTLVLFALGAFEIARAIRREADAERWVHESAWLVGLGASYAPWLSTDTPIFGGTKHWLTAYPFLCLVAGRGFALVRSHVAELLPEKWRDPRLVTSGLAATLLAGPFAMTLHSHPWGLTFYTPLVGGAPGAASLGLNRTFWGYTTGALVDTIDALAPEHATIYIHDTAAQSFELLKEDGRLRSDLSGTLALPLSKLALYHHEPHMRRVEYETWVLYGTVAPVAMGSYDGVPVVWLYERP